MSTRPSVWVFQEGKNDYSAAEEFGDVYFITKADWTKFLDSMQNYTAILDFKKFATDYIPGVDYLITAGNPILAALYIQSFQSYTGSDTHNYLKWDGRRAAYIPFIVKSIERGKI